MARRKQADDAAARIRNLIALDAANIMRRLEARQDEMIALFSRLRSREPLLSTLATRFPTATFQELARLTVREQAVVNAFYECLDELRWYFTYTEDMPSTAQQSFTTRHRRLIEVHRALVEAIGHPVGPDGQVVVDAEVVRREETGAAEALAPVARRVRPPRGGSGSGGR